MSKNRLEFRYLDLQQAIINSDWEDEIWVARGTYKPTTMGDQAVSFHLAKGQKLYGGFNGNEFDVRSRNLTPDGIQSTVLSGDLLNNDGSDPADPFAGYEDNSFHVLRITSENPSHANSVVDGFTIRGGNADAVDENGDDAEGGGVFINSSNGTITFWNCRIEKNSARIKGGGIAIHQDSQPLNSDVVLENTVVAENRVFNDSWSRTPERGGGIYIEGAELKLNNSELISNYLSGRGLKSGGGIAGDYSRITLNGSYLRQNDGGTYGGGIEGHASYVEVFNSVFTKNKASWGGAIRTHQQGLTIVNSDIIENKGIYAVMHQGGMGPLKIANNIFHLNAELYVAPRPASYNVDFNLIDVGSSLDGENNIQAESPGFVDMKNGDYRLMYASPAVDAGTPEGAPAKDFAGVERPEGPAVDIGAHEYSLNQEILPGWPKRNTAGSSSLTDLSIADIDGDPSNGLEVFVKDFEGNIDVWNKDGKDLPGWPVKTPITNAGTGDLIGNLDNNLNNGLEIIDSQGVMYVNVLGRSGKTMAGEWPSHNLYSTLGDFAMGDIDGDGDFEVIASGRDRTSILESDGSFFPTWPPFKALPLGGYVGIADVDGDPSNGSVIVWGQANADEGVTLFDKFGEVIINFPTPTRVAGWPAVGDLDGDGDKEIVATTTNDGAEFYVYAWHHDGRPVSGQWPKTVYSPGCGLWCPLSPPILADITGDHKLEIIVGAPNGSIYVWKSDGSILPNWPVNVDGTANIAHAVADVNNDGLLDVIVASGDLEPGNPDPNDDGQKVYAFNFNGTLLKGWPIKTKPHTFMGRYSHPLIGDLDNNGTYDLVISDALGNVYAFEIPMSDSSKDRAPWPMLQGNPQHTGTYQPPLIDVANGFGKTKDQFIFPLDQDIEVKEVQIRTREPMLFEGAEINTIGGFNPPSFSAVIPKEGEANRYLVELEDRLPIQTDIEDPRAAWTTIDLDVRSRLTGTKNKLQLNVAHLPGNVNQDREVNINDATQFGTYWAGSRPPELLDFNGDGTVNLHDVTVFGWHFMGTAGKAKWLGVGLPPLPR